MTPVFPGIQASDAFVVVPSDSVDVKDDANNPADYPFVFLHNPSLTDAIEVRVLPAAAHGYTTATDEDYAVTIGIPACGTSPLAVKRIFATTPTVSEGDVIAFASKQR